MNNFIIVKEVEENQQQQKTTKKGIKMSGPTDTKLIS